MGLPPELGFGALDLGLFLAAVAASLWVYGSRDTHGYVTVGYRVPFAKLPPRAKTKVYVALALGASFMALFLYRVT